MIRLENITKIYGSAGGQEYRIFEDLSLNIGAEESIAILGPSGSGKSTLLNLLGTLDAPTSGKVWIDNQDVSQLSKNELAIIRNKKIGFVFQQHHLLPQLSLIENILLPTLAIPDKRERKSAEKYAAELVDATGLSLLTNKYPGQLSGGECQRTAVVRALINKPKIILADEPTGSLDQETSEEVGNLITSLNTKMGVTIVVVTHSDVLAKKMNQQYLLKNNVLEPVRA